MKYQTFTILYHRFSFPSLFVDFFFGIVVLEEQWKSLKGKCVRLILSIFLLFTRNCLARIKTFSYGNHIGKFWVFFLSFRKFLKLHFEQLFNIIIREYSCHMQCTFDFNPCLPNWCEGRGNSKHYSCWSFFLVIKIIFEYIYEYRNIKQNNCWKLEMELC